VRGAREGRVLQPVHLVAIARLRGAHLIEIKSALRLRSIKVALRQHAKLKFQ
jgi:hypothetical protein